MKTRYEFEKTNWPASEPIRFKVRDTGDGSYRFFYKQIKRHIDTADLMRPITKEEMAKLSNTRVDMKSVVNAIYISIFMTQFLPNAVCKENTVAPSPPDLAEKGLVFFLPRDRREDVIGCLEEDYVINIVPKLGKRMARIWYWWQTIRTIWRYNGLTAWILNLVEEFKKSNSS